MTKYDILKKYFGYSSFRQGQEALIDALLSGRDVLGVMPTGSGKSICYQVPALMLEGITLVISPLISLMQDQVRALNQAGARAAYINSSLSESQITHALDLAGQGKYKIIYAAPERLETEKFLAFACNVKISMVAIDEAHCISQWGQDFRPSYLKIIDFIEKLPHRPLIGAFTATATSAVQEDIKRTLRLKDPLALVTGYDRKNLFFAVQRPKNKMNFVMDYIQKHPEESGIIYCITRKNVETVYDTLLSAGIAVTRYHAGLSNIERNQNQKDFIYDRSPVMVATNAFGMGIDKSNVRYIIHFNMPQSLENYYQEAGRAGRDGARAECILLYSPQDTIINRFLIEKKENPDLDEGQKEAVQKQDAYRLSIMDQYCRTNDCLRFYLLRYFGENANGRCMNCGNCLQEYEEKDATEEAKKVIHCILELPRSYGINVVAGTLAGSKRQKILDYHLDVLSCFGSLKKMGEDVIRELITQMRQDAYISVTPDQYALLRVTEKGRQLLNEHCEDKVLLRSRKEEKENIGSQERSNCKRRPISMDPKDKNLFEQLRSLRAEIATAENLPPYMVFNDKTLIDMCQKLPFTREEMLEVNGVAELKYQRYGEMFRKKILEFTGGERKEHSNEEIIPDKRMYSRRQKKTEFFLTPEQAALFPYEDSLLVTRIAERMSVLRDKEKVKVLTGAAIFRWIQAAGFARVERVDNEFHYEVTEKGKKAGIFTAPRMSQKGVEYMDIYYDRKAQEMIVKHYTKEEGIFDEEGYDGHQYEY